MNCAFLMLTGLPQAATAWMKSVWRARKAGVCSTSTTSATGLICGMSWTSVSTGTPSSSRTLSRIRRPSSMPGPAEALVRRAVGLVEARLEEEQYAELVGDRLQPLGGAQLQLLAFDDAGTGDEENGLVEPDLAAVNLHGRAFSRASRRRPPVTSRQGHFVARSRPEKVRRREFRPARTPRRSPARPRRACRSSSASPTASTASCGGLPARLSA